MVAGASTIAQGRAVSRTGRAFAFYIAVLGLLATALFALAMDEPDTNGHVAGTASRAGASDAERVQAEPAGSGRELAVAGIAGAGMIGTAGGVIWYAMRSRRTQ